MFRSIHFKMNRKNKNCVAAHKENIFFSKSGMFSAHHMLIMLEARIKHINKILADIQIS